MKWCPGCEQTKKTEAFNKDRTKKDGYTSYCSDCGRIKRQALRDKDPEGNRKRNRDQKRASYIPKVKLEGSLVDSNFNYRENFFAWDSECVYL